MATAQDVQSATVLRPPVTVTPGWKSSRVKVVKKHEGMKREKPLMNPRLPSWLSYLKRKARVLKNWYVGYGSLSHPKRLGDDEMVYIEPYFSLPVVVADNVYQEQFQCQRYNCFIPNKGCV